MKKFKKQKNSHENWKYYFRRILGYHLGIAEFLGSISLNWSENNQTSFDCNYEIETCMKNIFTRTNQS